MAEAVTDLPTDLSREDRVLLTLAQDRLAPVPRPFLALGESVGLTEETVIAKLSAFRERGLIRKIGPVFEPAALGLASELLAARVLPERLDAVGAAVASWPEITHCYAREHEVSLWFAGIAPEREWFASAADRVAAMEGVHGVWRLPTIRRFKIGVVFELTSVERATSQRPDSTAHAGAAVGLRLRLLGAIQSDLPLCPRPFALVAEEAGVSEDELVAVIAHLLQTGAMRRYGALVSHRRLGISANAMVVMQVPEDRIQEAGQRVAQNRSVSHCYQRPPFAGFPYDLYAMIHGTDRQACLATAGEAAAAAGATDWQALFSTREYGKSAPDYARLVAAKGGEEWR